MISVKSIPDCIIYCEVLAVLYCNGWVIVFPYRIGQQFLTNLRIFEYELHLLYKVFLTLTVNP